MCLHMSLLDDPSTTHQPLDERVRSGRCISIPVRFSARVQADTYVPAAKWACEVGTRLGRVVLVRSSADGSGRG